MTTPSRIVVGVDGSPASVTVLRWAARQAQLTGSSLDAIISWEQPVSYGNELLYDDAFDWAGLARSTLVTTITAAGADTAPALDRVVRKGHPAEVLVDASAGASLLVVGSRGHGGFAGLILGSVSQHVAAYAHCPVVVVREPGDQSPPARPPA